MAQGIVYITPVEIAPTADSTWRDVDVSSYIESGAVGVILQRVNTGETDYRLQIRKNGSTDDPTPTYYGDLDSSAWDTQGIGVDGDGVFEAYVENSAIELYIVGYVPSGAGEFETNMIRLDSWAYGDDGFYDMDPGAQISGGTVGIAIGQLRSNVDAFSLFVRPNGSTDTLSYNYLENAGIHGYFIGVDEDELFEAEKDLNNWLWVFHIGCIYDSHAVGFTNRTEYATTSTAWSDKDLSGEIPSGGGGAICGPFHTSQAEFGLRKNGASDTHTSGKDYQTDVGWGWMGLDDSRILEIEAELSYAPDFAIYGYTKDGGSSSNIKKLSGVAQASLKEVIGVASASISKIAGVSN